MTEQRDQGCKGQTLPHSWGRGGSEHSRNGISSKVLERIMLTVQLLKLKRENGGGSSVKHVIDTSVVKAVRCRKASEKKGLLLLASRRRRPSSVPGPAPCLAQRGSWLAPAPGPALSQDGPRPWLSPTPYPPWPWAQLCAQTLHPNVRLGDTFRLKCWCPETGKDLMVLGIRNTLEELGLGRPVTLSLTLCFCPVSRPGRRNPNSSSWSW